MNPLKLLPAFNAPWRERFAGDAGQWAEGILQLPSTRHPVYLRKFTPHFAEIFATLANRRKKRVHILGPAGSGKSMIGEIEIVFSVQHEPCSLYWVWPIDDDARDQVEDRLLDVFTANHFLPVQLPQDRRKRRNTKIIFPEMTFQAVGANESNAQRVRVTKLRMEEPHLYEPGFMAKFRRRLIGAKAPSEATFSTGSVLEDESDIAWKEGSQKEAEVRCPLCWEYFVPKDDHIKWDKNETTWDEAKHEYRANEMRASVRFECPLCNGALPSRWNVDDHIDDARLEMIQDYRWTAQNPNASDEVESFHWNFFFVPWLDIRDVAQEKIRATFAAHRGQLDLLKDYVQKILAEAWDDSPRTSDQHEFKGGYVLGAQWDDELTRFLSIDVQKDHFWYVVRAYAADGCSRLIARGRAETYDDLEGVRLANSVDPRRTGIDAAYDNNIVLQHCIRFGWFAFIAQDRASFPHHRPNKKPLNLPYSQPQRGPVGLGLGGKQQIAIYFLWSNPTIKDLWHNTKGRKDSGYSVADNAGEIYEAQTKAEYKRQEITKGGGKVWRYYTPQHKDDHLGSAEQINLVMAVMDGKLPQGKTNLANEQHESTEEGFSRHLVNQP